MLVRIVVLMGVLVSLMGTSTTAWMQSGDSIVYAAEVDGNRDVYVMSGSGGQSQRLTDDPGEDISPAWSPDRQQIAFVSNRTGDFEIYVMNADGSSERNVSNNQRFNGAPDAARIQLYPGSFQAVRLPHSLSIEIVGAMRCIAL